MLAIDKLWGIEREKDSELFGQIVVPVVILWDRPGGVYARVLEDEFGENNGPQTTGALAHGSEVFVTGEAVFKDFNWSKVEADVWHEGQNFHQIGWVRDSLLKDKGEIEYVGNN